MKSIKALLAVSLALAATPALAWEDISDDTVCGFGQEFESGTMLLLTQSKEDFDRGQILFGFFNDKWSVMKGQPIAGDLRLDASDGSWMTKPPIASDHGVIAAFSEKYVAYFNDSSVTVVKVTQGGKTLAQLNWDGFWLAFMDFDRCRKKKGWLDERKAKEEELASQKRQREYRKVVPEDPFAPAPKPTPAPKPRP